MADWWTTWEPRGALPVEGEGLGWGHHQRPEQTPQDRPRLTLAGVGRPGWSSDQRSARPTPTHLSLWLLVRQLSTQPCTHPPPTEHPPPSTPPHASTLAALVWGPAVSEEEGTALPDQGSRPSAVMAVWVFPEEREGHPQGRSAAENSNS